MRPIPLLFTCMLLLSSLGGYAQVNKRKLGNEWIKYDQPYYKVKVKANGFISIPASEFSNAGVDLNAYAHEKLQVFFRGVEIPVFVNAPGGTFSSVEFFAEKNDGSMDSVLYNNPSEMSNKGKSLYSDSSVYFITWGQTNGLRYNVKPFIPNAGTSSRGFYYHTVLKNYTNIYYDGAYIIPAFTFASSEYNSGEGYMSPVVAYNTTTKAPGVMMDSLQVSRAVYAGNMPELEFRVSGKSDYANEEIDHRFVLEVSADKVNWRTVKDTLYGGYKTLTGRIRLLREDLGNTAIYVRFKAMSHTGNVDVFAVAYVGLKYSRSFYAAGADLDGQYYHTTLNSGDTRFAYAGPIKSQPKVMLIDPWNAVAAEGQLYNDSMQFLLPNTGRQSKLILWTGAYNSTRTQLAKVNFTGYNPALGANYLIVTHPMFKSGVNEYISYKSGQRIDSASFFKPIAVYTPEIYDEFFYGYHHGAAIQNFLRYAYQKASAKPKFVWFVGKGWQNDLSYANYASDLVPMVGVPSSDLMMINRIDDDYAYAPDSTIAPLMSVGRLTCTSPIEFSNYFNKLKEYESLTTEKWRKDIVEIAGGYGDAQYRVNLATMEKLSAIARDKYAGANPKIYSANNSDPVIKDLKTQIQSHINKGAGMVTYLAHGSLNTLGVDIGDTVTLNNKGKYPIIYINGCNVGNPGYSATSLGEWYVKSKDKGAIIWLSHSNVTLDNVMPVQMGAFYRNFTKETFGKTIGEAWAKTIADMDSVSKRRPEFRSLCLQWVIQGDPTVRFGYPEKSDFAITAADLTLEPENVLSTDDSFHLVINAHNYGKYGDDTFNLRVIHTKPGNKQDTINTRITSFGNSHQFKVKIVNKGGLQGDNNFSVFFDSEDNVAELDEENNSASLDYYIAGTGIRPLYPADFGIVATDTPALMVQSRDLFDNKSGVYFEIDTVPDFNSPLLKKSARISGSNVITWKPQLMMLDRPGKLKDSQVYYWRSRLDLPADSGGGWETHSFTYIQGSAPGWSQSHFGQWRNLKSTALILDTIGRTFSYQPKYRGLTLTSNAMEFRGLGIKTDDGEILNFNVKNDKTLIMAVFDKNTLAEYRENTFDYTTKACGCIDPQCLQYLCTDTFPVYYLQFQMNLPAERARFISYVDKIPEGNYVAVMTRLANNHYQFGDSNLSRAFRKIGATMWAELIDAKKERKNLSCGSIGIKGNFEGISLAQDTAYDVVKALAPDKSDMVNLRVVMKGYDSPRGHMVSSDIGPAVKWHKLNYNFDGLEPDNSDKVKFLIHANDRYGRDSLISDTIYASNADISFIDAGKHPKIRIEAITFDRKHLTPAQFGLWQVLYTAVPEGSIVIDSTYSVSNGNFIESSDVKFSVKYQNIGATAIKPGIAVAIYVDSKGHSFTDTLKYKALVPGESFVFRSTRNTLGMSGNVKVQFRVNPGYYQPELTLDNNFIKWNFDITNDAVPPTLKVTFNEKILSNNEIIVPKQVIRVEAKDDNALRFMDDTSLVQMWMKYPNDTAFTPLHFSSPFIKWMPSHSPAQAAIAVIDHPSFATGTYTFRAQAKDKSGNPAGSKPYEISFRVIAEEALSKIYLAPNPVTDIARFYYTFYGTETPDEAKLYITNTQGYVVGTYDLVAQNVFHYGENTFTWDPVNSAAGRLPSGVYHYRFVIKLRGQDIAKFARPEDQIMEKTYGRFVIIR